MAQSLDKVLQPDGSYKWELVELRAANLYEKDKPAKPAAKPRPKRSAKAAESMPESADYEF